MGECTINRSLYFDFDFAVLCVTSFVVGKITCTFYCSYAAVVRSGDSGGSYTQNSSQFRCEIFSPRMIVSRKHGRRLVTCYLHEFVHLQFVS